MDASNRESSENKKIVLSKWRWTPEEDQLLINLVDRHGPRNWNFIADHIEGRTGKSCRFRWVTQLNPRIDKSLFSEGEVERLVDLHRSHGNQWSKILRFFPGRTDNQLKNKYHVLAGTRNKKGPRNNQFGTPDGGSENFSHHGCASAPAIGSQFSFFPHSTDMHDGIAMPILNDGSFSVNGRDENLLAASFLNPHSFESVDLGNVFVNQKTGFADSIMSDVRSAALPEILLPMAQPSQIDGFNENEYGQFIDFLGVGN